MTTRTQEHYLPGKRARGLWMRIDTATILKRHFFCERALIISQAGWVAAIPQFEIKMALPYFFWQDAMTADALRQRVFELRYPSRLMEIGDDAPLIETFREAINAPGPEAFVLSLARIFKPALLAAYVEYANKTDELADGPSLRFMRQAIEEKAAQVAALTRYAATMLQAAPERRDEAEAWVAALGERLDLVGGISIEAPRAAESPMVLPGRREFKLAEIPTRAPEFHLLHYYWPDIIDPHFPYGEGIQLQLRSAVSHFNEVWAVETGGAILHAFADNLEWEFIYDAARWTYDEARHARMGYDRLVEWGFEPREIPLGTYIYDSARDQDPIIRLGMLHYFETKNIGKKTKRAEAFAQYQDLVSQHDMDFDWADETIHAHYGRRWHNALREKFPDRIPEVEEIHRRCDELVAAEIARATDEEQAETREVATAMIRKAEKIGLPYS
ncbi:MAG: DUF455 family protein [Ardenticatenaceae bacterium]|nr:DUF455 family protein [Ardenticatenaceae bacterium]